MGDNRHGGNQGGQGHGQNQGQGQGQGQNQGQGQGKPTDLGQKVDWMTYTHQELWEMINTGVDLKAAGSAQADWATVSKSLGEVQTLLAKAIGQSTQAWAGESADRAREALESVEKWALNTSEHADNVAKCIATEIDHVQTAREMMPPPAPAPPVVTPVGDAPLATPTPLVTPRTPSVGGLLVEDGGFRSPALTSDAGLTPSPSVRTPGAFTGIDTIAGPAIDSVVTADATHRQAAEVMAMFQQNSYEVDRTVPSFSPPTNPLAPPPPPPVVVTPNPSGPDGSGGGAGGGHTVVNNPGGTPNQRPGGTSARFGRGGFAGGRGGYGGRGAMPTPVGASGGGGGGPLAGPGGATGSLGADRGSANPGSVTSQFQAPKSVTPQSGMIGAAPMAAPPPVAGGGEKDRNRPGYLEDDDNVFGVDRKAAPPVISL